MSCDSNIGIGREFGAPDVGGDVDTGGITESLLDHFPVLVTQSCDPSRQLSSIWHSGVWIERLNISQHVGVLDSRDWQCGTSNPEGQKLVRPLLLLFVPVLNISL